ncbi:MAG: hypothetical protein ABII64_05550 [Elusimicrobiota bacterium]
MFYILVAMLFLLPTAGFSAEFRPMTDQKNTLVIADFDSWSEINNLGGKFAAWAKDMNDESQGCKVGITDSERVGTKGNSIRLMYDVDSPKIAYNGMSINVMGTDWTPYKYIVLSAKGDEEAGYTPRFKVELKNKKGQTGIYVLTGLTGDWKQFALPLAEFQGITRFHQMQEMTIVFDDMRCNPQVGVIYVDNIYLSQ